MQKLKIAIVSPYPPSMGTLNEYAYHLVAQFKKKEEIQEIVILTDHLTGEEKYTDTLDGIPLKFDSCWSFNSKANPINILKSVRKHKADAVFFNIHFLSFGDKKVPAALGLMTPLLCRLFGVPSVTLLHNIVESVDLKSAGISNNPILKFIYSIIGTLLTCLLLCSNVVAVTISRYVTILENKYKFGNVALIPHGSFETPEAPDFKLPAGPKKVMAFGKFGTYKKVEELIEAVEIVRSRTDQQIEIVIAGTDSPNSKGYLAGIEEKYAHVPQLTFTGYVEEEMVSTIFKQSAVVVFPYTSTTGSSGVLHQAGSYGNACVLPNIGDLKDLIEEEGYKGEYFLPGNAESLANAVEAVLINDAYRMELGEANYKAACSLPMSDIADIYVQKFSQIVYGNKFSSEIKNKELMTVVR